MPIQILMPALSPTMEEGTLAKWHVKAGDKVSSGDVIAEIETDKATMEVEAVDEGTIGTILIDAGTEHVAVNKPIAVLLEEGEDASAISDADAAAPSPQPPDQVRGRLSPATGEGPPAAKDDAGGEIAEAATDSDTSPQRGEVELRSDSGEGASPDQSTKANGRGRRVFASPLARRIAKERGVDLSRVNGSGPHGRILKADVESAKAGAAAPEPDQAEAVAPSERKRDMARATPQPQAGISAQATAIPDDQIFALYEQGSYDLVPHDNMRKVIARRLTQAKATIPHFYLSADCEIDALLAARARLNILAPNDGSRAFKLSVNDFIIKALAMALQKAPGANATWTDQGLLRHRSSDVAVAVAIEGGLFTPVVRHAEVKSLSEISNEMKDLAHRARSKRLAPHEYQGGTTAISNLGMYGIKQFDAVINPPHASILAIGQGEKRPIVKDDQLEIATMMSVTLSVDHRVIDGALGAELLGAFKGFIEDPVTMLM